MTKAGITITVRMKSTRLPLKAIRYISGKPMIEHMIDRLKKSEKTDTIILCTSVDEQDDILIDIAKKKNIEFYRGSRKDVLKRLNNAAEKFDIDFIASTTGDNPLTSAKYIDRVIEKHEENRSDYITAKELPIGTYSHGVSKDALEQVLENKGKKGTEIWGHLFEENENINWEKIKIPEKLSSTDLRLTVDEEPDLRLIRTIFDQIGPKNTFPLEETVKFLKQNPKIASINSDVDHWSNN